MNGRLIVMVLALASASCSSEGADDSDSVVTPMETSGALLPWKEGNTWTYQVTGDGEQSTKITTIGALEAIGGTGPNAAKMAFKVTTKKGASDETISWQVEEGQRVVRYREQSFHAGELEQDERWEPAKLHVDMTAAHTAAGASWLESYQETKSQPGEEDETSTERDPWTVDAVDQIVTVPAGTFRAIVLTKAGGSNLKTYWYVPGVGKVKETGGQTELLVSYKVAP
jgi:hypothetical protein